MHYNWGEKTIGWMLDAAEYTGFYRNMAKLLLPYIQKRGTLCDIGCGLALTDLALAGEIGAITCVDVNATALACAEKSAAAQGLANLSFVVSDGKAARGSWETVMAMFHGHASAVCADYLSKATDRLLLVTHGADVHHGAAFCENAEEAARWLDAGGWRYTRQDAVLEFGQPHRSIEDALESTAAFHKELSPEALRAGVMAKLQETGRADFPYYTPKTRSFAIFDIPRAENAHLL